MEYKYTLDEVEKRLRDADMYVPSRATLSKLIRKEKLFQRGLAKKGLNGFEKGDVTGKEWLFNDDGILTLMSATTDVRHRRTKKQMKESRKVEQLEIGNNTFTFNDNGSMSYEPVVNTFEPYSQNEAHLQTWIDINLHDYIIFKAKAYNLDFRTILENIIEEDMRKAFPDIPKRW